MRGRFTGDRGGRPTRRKPGQLPLEVLTWLSSWRGLFASKDPILARVACVNELSVIYFSVQDMIVCTSYLKVETNIY